MNKYSSFWEICFDGNSSKASQRILADRKLNVDDQLLK